MKTTIDVNGKPVEIELTKEQVEQINKASRDWRNITTLEQVCEIAGENPKDLIIPAIVCGDMKNKRKRGATLHYIKEMICDVFKMGVVLDYSKSNQRKHYPYGVYVAGSGFSLHAVYSDLTLSSVGARLSVDEEEKVRHIWKHFSHIWIEHWEGK